MFHNKLSSRVLRLTFLPLRKSFSQYTMIKSPPCKEDNRFQTRFLYATPGLQHPYNKKLITYRKLTKQCLLQRDLQSMQEYSKQLLQFWNSINEKGEEQYSNVKLWRDCFTNVVECYMIHEEYQLIAELYDGFEDYFPNDLFDVMMVALQESNYLDKCLDLYKRMRYELKKRTKLNGLTLVSMVKAFAVKHEDLVTELFELMNNLPKNEITKKNQHYVLSEYLKIVAHGSEDAGLIVTVLDNILQMGFRPNAVSYNIVMHALCRLQREDLVESIYYKMVSSGVKMDTSTFNALFRSCKLSNGNYDMEKVNKYLTEMDRRRIQPDQITYENLVDIFKDKPDRMVQIFQHAKNNFPKLRGSLIARVLSAILPTTSIDDCIELVKKIEKKQGFIGNEGYNVLLNACINTSSTKLFEVLQMMMDANALPDQYTASTLLKPIKTVKEPKKYWQMLSPFILKVLKSCELPNLELITALVSAYTRLGEFNEITKLFQLVKEHPLNYKLDKQYFDCMFRACSYSGNVGLGVQLFDEMQKAQISMDKGTYVLLRNLFLKNKCLLKGKELKEAVACAKQVYNTIDKSWREHPKYDREFAAFCKIKETSD